MRRVDRAMSRDQALAFLKEEKVGRLGLICQGEPYIVPLNYVILDDRIYFHSAPVGRKVECLKQSPRVCFEVDRMLGIKEAPQACAFSAYFQSVIVYGTAQLVDNPSQKVRVLQALTSRYASCSFEPPTNEGAARTAVVAITIDSVTGKQSLPPDQGQGCSR